MKPRSTRSLVVFLLAASMALLIPGVFLPALSIRGVLTRDGIAHVAPVMLEQGLSDETLAVLRSMMNPSVLAFLEATGGDVRKTIIEQLGPRMADALQKNVADVEVYEQTRSIIGAAQRLYEVGSPVPATLILLFSVIVPFGKAGLAALAVFLAGGVWRRRTLRFVETIAKWSMADVFAVALFIAYLAAQASAAPTSGPNAAPAFIAFTAGLGPGFYWFASYCVFSLAAQQITLRLAASDPAHARSGADIEAV
jgi:Paraquat-inducible protein A